MGRGRIQNADPRIRKAVESKKEILKEIGKARRPGEDRVHSHELAIVNRISEAINSTRSLKEVLGIIAKKIVEISEKGSQKAHTAITLLDEEKNCFRVQVEEPPVISEKTPELLTIGIKGRPEQEKLVRDKEPIIIQNLADDHAFRRESKEFDDIANAIGIRSILVVPMVYKGNVIGTIGVDSLGRPRKYAPREIELYKTIANQAAAAIENARFYERENEFRSTVDRLNLAKNLKEVVRKILGELKSITDYARASIQMIENGNRILIDGEGFDLDKIDFSLLLPIDKDRLIKGIIDRKTVEIVPNTREHGLWEQLQGTDNIHSWIGLPLVYEDQVIAIITLDHDDPGFFGKGLAKRLTEFAGQASIALRKAYQFEQAQQHIHALELLNEVAKIVNTTFDNSEVLLRTISREVVRIMKCVRCDVWMLQEGGRALVSQVCSGGACRMEDRLLIPNPILPGYSPFFGAYLNGSQLISDANKEYRNPDGPERRKPPRSMVIAPIKIGDQTIGFICASHDRAGWFTQSHRLLLDALALHVGTAIQRHIGLLLLKQISYKMLKAVHVGEILDEIVVGAKVATNSDAGVIFLFNQDATAIIEHRKNAGSEHPHPRLDNENGITRTVIREKKILPIPDLEADPRVNVLLRPKYKSMIAVPLLVQDRILGVLYLNDSFPHVYTDTEKSYLETLANQAALAIERAANQEAAAREKMQLYQRIQDSLSALVNNISHCLFRKNTKFQFTFANHTFLEWVGKTSEEVMGRTDYDLFQAEQADRFRRDDERVIATCKPVEQVEVHEVEKSGRKILVRVLKTPILDAEGKVSEIQGMFWDVTEEMELRENEKRARERYQALVEQSPDAVVIHKNSLVILANEAASTLLGSNRNGGILGRSILDFVHREDKDLAHARLIKLLNKERLEKDRMRLVRKNGEVMKVEVYARSLPAEGEIQVVFRKLGKAR